eukprot:2777634-Alexandrium_andersonii.AAC.1
MEPNGQLWHVLRVLRPWAAQVQVATIAPAELLPGCLQLGQVLRMRGPQLFAGQAAHLLSGAQHQPHPVAPDPEVVLPVGAEKDAALVARTATPLLSPVSQTLALREGTAPRAPLSQHGAPQRVAHLELVEGHHGVHPEALESPQRTTAMVVAAELGLRFDPLGI